MNIATSRYLRSHIGTCPGNQISVHMKQRVVRVNYNTYGIEQLTDYDEMRTILRTLRTGELISRLEQFGGETLAHASQLTLTHMNV